MADIASQNKTRLPWIDIAKGIAIILVIIGHTIGFGLARDMIFTFHMPLFFILAGYTFRTKPMGETVRTSAKRLLLPYVLIFLIWYICVWFFQDGEAFSLHTFEQLIGRFVFASGVAIPLLPFEAVGMAWFLVCLFFSRIILNFFMSIFEKRNIGVLVQLIVFAAIAALGIFIGSRQWYLPFSFDVAMVATAFMWVGYIAKQYRFMEGLGKTWWVALIALALYALAVLFSNLELAARVFEVPLLAFLGAIAGTLFCCRVSMFIQDHVKFVNTYLAFMGRNSMLIYCFHTLDWLVPWANFAALQNVPFGHFIAAVVRVAYATLLTVLVKHV